MASALCHTSSSRAWSPELLVSAPFPMHSTIRRELLLAVGGFDSAFDGTQDWELLLRLSERTNKVARIPRVLYHWRMGPDSAAGEASAKPYVFERQLLAIQNHMRRRGAEDAVAFWAHPEYCSCRVDAEDDRCLHHHSHQGQGGHAAPVSALHRQTYRL